MAKSISIRLFSNSIEYLVIAGCGGVTQGGSVRIASAWGGLGVVIIRYPNTFGNLITSSGLTYRNSLGNN